VAPACKNQSPQKTFVSGLSKNRQLTLLQQSLESLSLCARNDEVRQAAEKVKAIPNAKPLLNFYSAEDNVQDMFPLPQNIIEAGKIAAEEMGRAENWMRNMPGEGLEELKAKIARVIYADRVCSSDLFIMPGVTSTLHFLLDFFGRDLTVAVQEPCYPNFLQELIFADPEKLIFLSTTPENGFSFYPEEMAKANVIYLFQPNNPTGRSWSREELAKWIAIAKNNGSLIIFDRTWSSFQPSQNIFSIYELEEAADTAIELESFSYSSNLSFLRISWMVIPSQIAFKNGSSVQQAWKNYLLTFSRGVSLYDQKIALAALDPSSQAYFKKVRSYYLQNAQILKQTLLEQGFEVYGDSNAPFLWVRQPGKSGAEIAKMMLEKYQILVAKGDIFGPSGTEFVRFITVGPRSFVEQAVQRLNQP
jgi:LL-diaminopimelate aminotransferase